MKLNAKAFYEISKNKNESKFVLSGIKWELHNFHIRTVKANPKDYIVFTQKTPTFNNYSQITLSIGCMEKTVEVVSG